VSRRNEPGKPIDERWHFPAQQSGCYYQRIEDCCWVCVGRIFLTHLRTVGRLYSPLYSESESESDGDHVRHSSSEADDQH